MALADTANLIVALRLDDQFSGPMRRAQGSLTGLQGSFGRIGRGVGQVASGFDRIATRAALAAAGGLTAVVKTAIDFEDAWAGVEKTVNETDLTKVGLSFEKLQEQFRAMAREIPVSFEELSAIGEQAGALGIAADDITNFTEVVAKLGVTTDLSSDQAATALGQLGTILQLSGEEFDQFADSLVNLGNQGASTESQIIQVAARFAAAGQQAGLTKEEILGLASTAASMGIQVEAAGSSLSRIFNSVTTNIGTGSDKAKEFAKVIGLPFREFRKAWDEDASGTFEDFLRELGKLNKFEQASVLKSIGITNVRDINAIQLMAQNTKELARQLDVARSSAGALNKEAEKRFATTASAIQRFKNVARDIGFVVGRELLPVINDALADLTNELAKPESQRAIKEFATNLAQGARDLVAAFKRGEFQPLIDTMKGAAVIAKTAFDAFNALPGPVKQLALAAIVANKVSGGAVGSIAKGLANIFVGFGGIFARGSSPANPLWVTSTGGIGGPGGAAGRLGLAGGLLLTGGAAATTAGGIMALDDLKRALEEGSEEGVKAGVLDFTGGFPSLIGKFVQDTFFPTGPKVTSPQSSTPLGQFSAANRGGTPANPLRVWDERNFNRAAADEKRTQAQLSRLSLEQRLIQDPNFKRSIDNTAEFIRLLKRTSEFGAKGQGTDIERGRTTGRDPLADAFVALVRRLDKGLIKDPQVFGEIDRHIQALEQVQGRLLKEGNLADARHAQRNIDALHRLLGTTDTTNAILRHLNQNTNSALSVANRNLADGNRRQREIAQRIDQQRATLNTGFARSNEQLGVIARKDFSPAFTANVYTTLNAQVSAVSALSQITRVSTIRSGFQPFGPNEF